VDERAGFTARLSVAAHADDLGADVGKYDASGRSASVRAVGHISA